MGKNFGRPASVEDADKPSVKALGELACTNTTLRRAARRLGHLYDEALAPLDLKATQLSLLAEIDKFASTDGQEGPTLQDLATRLGIRISAVTHALRPLVRDGLIAVRQDTYDGRTKRGFLTSLGKARLRRALVLWDVTNRRVEVVLGPESAAMLRELADKVASEEFLLAFNSRTSFPPGRDSAG